jgi:hypothetical protein
MLVLAFAVLVVLAYHLLSMSLHIATIEGEAVLSLHVPRLKFPSGFFASTVQAKAERRCVHVGASMVRLS